MKTDALNEMTRDELLQKGQELKRSLFNLRFQMATNQQENTALLGLTRRDIARVKTLLRERDLARGNAPAQTEAGDSTEA